MRQKTYDPFKHIFNDLAVRRQAAAHRGDADEVRRIDEDERETLALLSRPATRVIHGARPSETFTI